eukprot:jgi/Hompol1/2917/HPOL_005664-RA
MAARPTLAHTLAASYAASGKQAEAEAQASLSHPEAGAAGAAGNSNALPQQGAVASMGPVGPMGAEPPSYLDALWSEPASTGDGAPPPSYYDTSLSVTPAQSALLSDDGDVLIDGMPVGDSLSLLVNIFVSTTFDFLGFMITALLATSHAAKYGSQCGLGLTFVRLGLFIKDQSENDAVYGPDAAVTPGGGSATVPNTNTSGSAGDFENSPAEERQRREWSAFLLIIIGMFIFIGFIMAFFTTQNITSLPKIDVLVSCMANIFMGEDGMCRQFWEEDYVHDERRALLDLKRRRFPLEFGGFLELCAALIGDPYTADAAFKYLSNLQSFADFLRDGYVPSNQGALNEYYQWSGGTLVLGSSRFGAPAGTLARRTGEGVLLLDFKYSAWHLFEAVLESFLYRAGQFDTSLQATATQSRAGPLVGTSDTTIAILKLFTIFFASADRTTVRALMAHLGRSASAAPKPAHADESMSSNFAASDHDQQRPEERIVGLLSAILDRVCHQRTPNLEIITHCIKLLKLLLPHFPALPSLSYMQQDILPVERAVGTYTATTAFLELFIDLVQEAQGTLQDKWSSSSRGDVFTEIDDSLSDMDQRHAYTNDATAYLTSDAFANLEDAISKAEVLRSIVSFLILEIFPTHRSWRYQSIADKFTIGLLILESFNSIMGHVCWANAATQQSTATPETVAKNDHAGLVEISKTYTLLAQAFLQTDSTQHILALLDIVGTSNESLEHLHRHRRIAEGKLLETLVIKSMRLVIQLISQRIQTSTVASILEVMLLDRTMKRAIVGSIDLVHLIGRYVVYEQNTMLAKLAVDLLTLLCEATSTLASQGSKAVSFV